MYKLLTFWEQFEGEVQNLKLDLTESHHYSFPKKRDKENAKCVLIQPYNESSHYIKLSYFVGIDWIKEKEQAIYVEPKINTRITDEDLNNNNIHEKDIKQTDYLKMLFFALKQPDFVNYAEELFEIKWKSPLIEVKRQQDLLTPLLVVQFLKIVQSIVRKGLKKSYYKVQHNLYSKVKGKVLVSQTIKQNLCNNKPLNTFCCYDEFGLNGLENRLLKKALLFVQRYLPSLANMNAEKYAANVFNYINPAFFFVSDEVSLYDVKHTKTNVFYKEYEDGIHLAKLILKRFGYNISNTQKETIKTPPFWIDMSKLFELYVYSNLKEKYGQNICFQYGDKKNETSYGKPDFLLTLENEKMIIEAKYKSHYKAKNISFDNYLIKDIRQLSGYSRDKGVLNKLGYITKEEQMKSVVKCLIIYPDQESKENLWENEEKEIKQFLEFYKRSIALPVIKNNLE